MGFFCVDGVCWFVVVDTFEYLLLSTKMSLHFPGFLNTVVCVGCGTRL